jgi:hypothetical protein
MALDLKIQPAPKLQLGIRIPPPKNKKSIGFLSD